MNVNITIADLAKSRFAAACQACLMGFLPASTFAQADPVKAASDAFGTSIGRESLGLYSSASVRGFSPTQAGNVRIDGLYFDPVADLLPQLRSSTQLRVGLSMQGYAFPAPTGIVDHKLYRPSAAFGGTGEVGMDSFGGSYADVGLDVPLSTTLRSNFAASYSHFAYGNTNEGAHRSANASVWWQPTGGAEFGVFVSRRQQLYDEAAADLMPVGSSLPPAHPWRADEPSWARYVSNRANHGMLLRNAWASTQGELELRAGMFRSSLEQLESYVILLTDLQQDGSARRLLIADPAADSSSTSGEVRLTWTPLAMPSAGWVHRVHIQATGREREKEFGGSQVIDYGMTRLGQSFEPPKPAFAFGSLSVDKISQRAIGLGYEARAWRQLELNVGAQRVDYRKSRIQSGQPSIETKESPWIGYLSSAWHINKAWAIYGGFTRGLEESGVAPPSATNRGQALPAVETRQADLGARWHSEGGLKLVIGAFAVEKPYFNTDGQGRYGEVGRVRHSGLELSVSGDLGKTLRIVAGAAVLDPTVVTSGSPSSFVGRKAVGVARNLAKLNVAWQPLQLRGASIDLAVNHVGPMWGTNDNSVVVPGSTKVNLGVRVPVRVGGLDKGSIRLLISNLGNSRSFDVLSSGSYFPQPTRSASVSWSASW